MAQFRDRPPGNIYYRNYQTRDGVLAVGCLSDPLRKRLASVLDIRDIRFEPGYDPASEEARAFGQALEAQTEALFRERTNAEWIGILDAAGIPCGPVRFIEELVEDEQVLANDLVVELEHDLAGPLKMAGPILRMSGTPLQATSASPSLGQHTDEILAELGYTAQEVERFREQGITL